ncbi:MAG TPA: hypothetical protein VG944_18300 [Fimbriimonas sp.]|nr:hypothetical protein [Fimbriimonas sp.]
MRLHTQEPGNRINRDWFRASAFKGVVVLAATLLVLGCKPPEQDDGPAKPPVVAFQGQIDSTLVGGWKTQDKRSGLDLGKDGTAKILATATSPSGPVISNLKGSWLVSPGRKLLLKYSVKGQPETVIQYRYILAANKLTLSDESGRMKTVYSRK